MYRSIQLVCESSIECTTLPLAVEPVSVVCWMKRTREDALADPYTLAHCCRESQVSFENLQAFVCQGQLRSLPVYYLQTPQVILLRHSPWSLLLRGHNHSVQTYVKQSNVGLTPMAILATSPPLSTWPAVRMLLDGVASCQCLLISTPLHVFAYPEQCSLFMDAPSTFAPFSTSRVPRIPLLQRLLLRCRGLCLHKPRQQDIPIYIHTVNQQSCIHARFTFFNHPR